MDLKQEGIKVNREQAHEILMKYMKGENYITHSYAVEAIMKGLAKRLAGILGNRRSSA